MSKRPGRWIGGLAFFALWWLSFAVFLYARKAMTSEESASRHGPPPGIARSRIEHTTAEQRELIERLDRIERKVDAALRVMDDAGFRVSIPPQEAPRPREMVP